MFENYAGDERVTKYMPWKAYNKLANVISFLESVVKDYEKTNTYHWVVEYEGKRIGDISVSVNDLRNNCEAGYCIGYDFWNKGITSEALAAIIKFFLKRLECTELWLSMILKILRQVRL